MVMGTATESTQVRASGLRDIATPFVADSATGVCIRTRLKALTDTDERVLREVGAHLGQLASADLAERVADGLDHDKQAWADRKRTITDSATARWADGAAGRPACR